MTQPNIEDTQPSHIQPQTKRSNKSFWIWSLFIILIFVIAISVGILTGYQAGRKDRAILRSNLLEDSLRQQYDLGMQDMADEHYLVARQRFEYVLSYDPSYPGITDKLAKIITVLNSTVTPSPQPTSTATPTLTPTPDMRPLDERIAQSLTLIISQGWDQAIDLLISVRQQDSAYQVARVDRLLYLALRQRGVSKILQQNNLEGGIYDLTLAENYGPIDAEAEAARNIARMYLIGSSFWEAYPAQAVYYFAQVAASAPYLRDASGWTALERYRGALVQYGDQLMREGEWCQALEQYQIAAGIRSDQKLSSALGDAILKCYPPTEELIATATPTLSPTPTITPVNPFPPTSTPGLPPPDTETPTLPPTDTPPPLPTDTPEPSPTSAP